jgi:hypothetical protein
MNNQLTINYQILKKALESDNIQDVQYLLSPLVKTVPVYKKKKCGGMVEIGGLTINNELVFIEPKRDNADKNDLNIYTEGFYVEGESPSLPEDATGLISVSPEGFNRVAPVNMNQIYEVTDTSNKSFSVGYMVRDKNLSSCGIIFYDQYCEEEEVVPILGRGAKDTAVLGMQMADGTSTKFGYNGL